MDLLVLVLDDGDVFLLSPSLYPELFGVLVGASFVLVADLLLASLGVVGDLPDLVAESGVLLARGLGLLLQTALVRLVLGHQLHVVPHHLVVEHLLLLQLLQHSLDLLRHLKVTNALLLLVRRTLVSQTQQHTLVVHSLVLDLRVQSLHFLPQLLRLVVWQIYCSQYVWSLHIVVYRRILLVVFNGLSDGGSSANSDASGWFHE